MSKNGGGSKYATMNSLDRLADTIYSTFGKLAVGTKLSSPTSKFGTGRREDKALTFCESVGIVGRIPESPGPKYHLGDKDLKA
jgi:hypothetical protein